MLDPAAADSVLPLHLSRLGCGEGQLQISERVGPRPAPRSTSSPRRGERRRPTHSTVPCFQRRRSQGSSRRCSWRRGRRAEVAQRRVLALTVVEHFDVVEERRGRRGARSAAQRATRTRASRRSSRSPRCRAASPASSGSARHLRLSRPLFDHPTSAPERRQAGMLNCRSPKT